MNRRKPRGDHEQARPPQASQNMIAILIISFFIAALLIGLILLICASHKLAGDANGKPPKPRPVVSSFPLGGGNLVSGTNPREVKGMDKPTRASVTTHILHDEPLEGGDSSTASLPITLQGGGKSDPIASDATAPQQRSMWTTNATAYVRKVVAQQEAARVRRIAVWRINTYLAHKGSPMQGCGEFYIQNQERTGIPGALSAGIAEAESTNGMRTYNSHTKACPGESYNAWGMISSRFYGGFGSWENGIRANFDWLMEWHSHGGTQPPQTIHDCSGYCEGNTTSVIVDWAQSVINGYEVPGGLH